MRSGVAGHLSGDARIVGNFDGTLVGHEASFNIKPQRARMVSRAGVQPDTLRVVFPCKRKAMLQKCASCALSDERGCYTKIRQLNVGEATAVELQQAVVFKIGRAHV